MKTEEVFTTLLAAAAFLKNPIQDVAGQSIKDTYQAVKYFLQKKFQSHPEANKALELATEKPESEARKAVLMEEAVSVDVGSDPDVIRLIEQLGALLPKSGNGVQQDVRVNGRGHRVQVAGGDIITAERHVRRNVITPGDEHVNPAQRKQLVALITQVAARLAGEDGRPRFGAVHAMLQRRLDVTSYLLIPVGKFEEAVNFLKQQCAIHRSRLCRRNPAAYEADFLRMIHARRIELGWIKPELYAFAEQKLGLKKRLTSLLALGPHQLKTLAEAMPRAVVGEQAD